MSINFVSGSSPFTYGSGPYTNSGLYAGLNTKGLLHNLVKYEESIPMQTLQRKEDLMKDMQAIWSQYSSLLGSLQYAADALKNPSLFTNETASSSSNILSVSTVSGAAPGAYNVTVKQMASAEVVASNYSGTPTLANSGTFTINGKSISVSSGSASPVTVQQVATAINGAQAGVNAVVQNGQISIASTTTGSLGSTYTDGSGGILTALGIVSGTGAKNIQTSGKDAIVNVSGTQLTQASNTFTNGIPGITFSITGSPLNQTAGDNVTLTVASDVPSLQSAVQNFVNAFNGLQSFLAQNNVKAAPLASDPSTLRFQNQITATLKNPINSLTSGWNSLSNFGITMQQDGTLALDTAAFSGAMQNHLSDFQNLWNQPVTGIATVVDAGVGQLTNPATGILAKKLDGVNSMIVKYDHEMRKWTSLLTLRHHHLNNHYSSMEKSLLNLKDQGNAMAGMVASSNSKNG